MAALRETVTDGRTVALRETVPDVRPDAAPVVAPPRTTRFATRADVVEDSDLAAAVAIIFDADVPDARGLGAWAANASTPATTAAIATKHLQKSATSFFKLYISLSGHYTIFSTWQSTPNFTRYNNLLHFLPNRPNDARPNAIAQHRPYPPPAQRFSPIGDCQPHIFHIRPARFF